MNERMDKIAKRVTHLYTFSSVIQEINASIESDISSAWIIAAIIERDPSISAMVLRLANSSYYGLSQRVATMATAITVLGLQTIKGLINTASVLKIFAKARFGIMEPVGFWLHNLGCAVSSRALVGNENAKVHEEAFLCGLLHDIGTLVLLENEPAAMERIYLQVHDKPGRLQSEVEMEVLGFTHTSLGAHLAKLWHFPETMIEAVRCHHNPNMFFAKSRPEDNNDAICSTLTSAVHTGNIIAKALALGTAFDEKVSPIQPDAWNMLGIELQELAPLMISIKQEFCELRDTMSLIG